VGGNLVFKVIFSCIVSAFVLYIFTGLSDRWRQKGSTLSTSCLLYAFSFVRFPRVIKNYYSRFSMERSLGNNILRI
jgi:hypothetical protein